MKEFCQCGCLKECHLPHTLDEHGGNCQHCDCKCYTWKDFLWTTKEAKEKFAESSGGEQDG